MAVAGNDTLVSMLLSGDMGLVANSLPEKCINVPPVILRGEAVMRSAAGLAALVSLWRPSLRYTIRSGIRFQSHSDSAQTHSGLPAATGGASVVTHPRSMCCHRSSNRRAWW